MTTHVCQEGDSKKYHFMNLSPHELKDKGNNFISDGNYKEAIDYYSRAIEKDPTFYICFANRACAHLKLNQYALALADCQKAIAINKNYAKAHNRMGTAYFHQNNYSAAVEAYRHAAELDPSNAMFQMDLKRAQGKFEEAKKHETNLGEKKKDFEKLSAQELKVKGNEFLFKKNYKEAIDYYSRAIEKDPTFYIGFANRACAHLQLNHCDLAIADCQKAIAINENYAKAHTRMGTAYFFQGNYSAAVKAYSCAVVIEPSNETYRSELQRAQIELIKIYLREPHFMSMLDHMKATDPEMASLLNQNIPTNANESQQNITRKPDGTIVTAFGVLSQSQEKQLNDLAVNNRTLQKLFRDVEEKGTVVFDKYKDDPEIRKYLKGIFSIFKK